MPDGFKVDLGALQKAAEGVTDTLNALATKKVSDIDAKESAFGHDKLGGTVSDFCERWQIGVEHLAKDGQEVADRLNASVNAYTNVERRTHANLNGMLQQPSGPDPAAQ
jgi:hypothetical protein